MYTAELATHMRHFHWLSNHPGSVWYDFASYLVHFDLNAAMAFGGVSSAQWLPYTMVQRDHPIPDYNLKLLDTNPLSLLANSTDPIRVLPNHGMSGSTFQAHHVSLPTAWAPVEGTSATSVV